MSSRYGCTCCLAVFMFVWVEKIVISSADVISFILCLVVLGCLMCSYILNRVGESTSPCGVPVFIVACFAFVLLYSVYFASPNVVL